LRIFESAQNALVRPLYPCRFIFNDQNFNGCDAAALFSRFINSASSPHQTGDTLGRGLSVSFG
jgi:hypothetical protein